MNIKELTFDIELISIGVEELASNDTDGRKSIDSTEQEACCQESSSKHDEGVELYVYTLKEYS